MLKIEKSELRLREAEWCLLRQKCTKHKVLKYWSHGWQIPPPLHFESRFIMLRLMLSSGDIFTCQHVTHSLTSHTTFPACQDCSEVITGRLPFYCFYKLCKLAAVNARVDESYFDES